MNFLAHAYLSRHSVPLMVGNFIADFVKGNQIRQYDNQIVEGIIMHRKIDAFTDSHPVFKRSSKRIWEKYRHYSNVIIDLYYDHFLAKNWNRYSNLSLDHFAEYVYSVMEDHSAILPDKAQKILPYMIRYNWLVTYSEIEGIDKSLKGLSRRTPYDSKMEEAKQELIDHYEVLKQDFMSFFPEMIAFLEE